MTSEKSGRYIVIEGQDATGKSTQIKKLADYFRHQNQEVVTFDEPGGLPSTDQMRATILNRDHDLDPITCVLMYTTARRELWLKKAQPALDRGAIVLAARNWWSTLAYQGYGQGVDLDIIKQTTAKYLPSEYVQPNAACLLILDDAERAERLHGRDDSHAKDTFESKGASFQTRVNQGYEQIARDLDLPLVDASGTVDEVFARIIAALKIS